MYEQGHCVVGIEVVRQAVEEFFSENSLKYDVVHHEQIQADCYQVLYVFHIIIYYHRVFALQVPMLFSSPVGSLYHTRGVVSRTSCVVCVNHNYQK